MRRSASPLHDRPHARRLDQVDPYLLIATLLLIGYGLVMTYAVTVESRTLTGDPMQFVIRGAIWAVIGLAVMATVAMFDYAWLGTFAPLVYLFTLGLLGVVLAIGTSSLGAQRSVPFRGPAGRRLGPHPVVHRRVLRPSDRKGAHGGDAVTTRLSPDRGIGLRFRWTGGGPRIHGGGDPVRPLHPAARGRAPRRVPRARPVRDAPRRGHRHDARVPDPRERRHGDLTHARHGHPAPVHLARRQLAGVDLFRARCIAIGRDPPTRTGDRLAGLRGQGRRRQRQRVPRHRIEDAARIEQRIARREQTSHL